MTDNIINNEMRTLTFQQITKAEHFSNAMMQDCLNQRYQELSYEQLRSFLETAFHLTDERHLVNLLPRERMPGDFRDLMIYLGTNCDTRSLRWQVGV